MRNELRRARALAARAMEAGADLARDGCREIGLVLALSTVAGAAVFVADHADLPHDAAQMMRGVAWLALGLLFAPKIGALFRLAFGGPALKELGGGGLQWKRLEWRLLATTVALFGLAAILIVSWLLLVMAVLSGLRPLGVVTLGPLGQLGIGFLFTAPLFAGLAALILAGLSRLAVTLPAEVAEGRPRFARGWFVTRGETLAAGLVGAAIFLMPPLALMALQIALDALQAGDVPGFGGHGWPPLEAAAAGFVVAGLAEFVWAPFCVGALSEMFVMFSPPRTARANPPTQGPQPRVQSAAPRHAIGVGRAVAGGPGVVRASKPLGALPKKRSVEPRHEPAPSPRPRLRHVHSVDEIMWPPLAPGSASREAGGGFAAESQEP